MFRRQIASGRSIQVLHPIRRYSNENVRSKIQTIPFQFSPYDATRVMTMVANVWSPMDALYLGLSKLGFTQPTFQVSNLKPVLLPIWRVDLKGMGDIVFKDDKDTLSCEVTDLTIPGYQFPPLSDLNGSYPLPEEALQTYTAEHNNQYETDIVVIPFTKHPMNLLSAFKNGKRVITPEIDFDPSKITPVLFAAYPLYLPVYLGECNSENSGSATIVLYAHKEQPGMFSVMKRSPTLEDDEVPKWLPDIPRGAIEISMLPTTALKESAMSIEFDRASKKPGLSLSLGSKVEMLTKNVEAFGVMSDCPTIEEFEKVLQMANVMEYRQSELNREFMQMHDDYVSSERQYQLMRSMPDNTHFRGFHIGSHGIQQFEGSEQWAEHVMKHLKKEVDQKKQKLDEARPAWIK